MKKIFSLLSAFLLVNCHSFEEKNIIFHIVDNQNKPLTDCKITADRRGSGIPVFDFLLTTLFAPDYLEKLVQKQTEIMRSVVFYSDNNGVANVKLQFLKGFRKSSSGYYWIITKKGYYSRTATLDVIHVKMTPLPKK